MATPSFSYKDLAKNTHHGEILRALNFQSLKRRALGLMVRALLLSKRSTSAEEVLLGLVPDSLEVRFPSELTHEWENIGQKGRR